MKRPMHAPSLVRRFLFFSLLALAPLPSSAATPPTVSTVSPLFASAGVPTTFTVSYSQGASGVIGCELLIDGATDGPMTLQGGPSTGTASRLTSLVATGIHSIAARCYDATFTYGVSPTISLLVSQPNDHEPPLIFSLQPSQAVVGAAVMMNATVRDDQSGIAGCGLYVNDSYLGPMTIADQTAIRFYAFPRAGTFPIRIQCTDNTGNAGMFSGTVVVRETASSGLSPTRSSMSLAPSVLAADGATPATAIVTLRSTDGTPITGVAVHLLSSRGSNDDIQPTAAITDTQGRAQFTIRSQKQGIGTYTAAAPDIQISSAPTITFVAPQILQDGTALPGNLMKLPCTTSAITDPCRAVYFYGGDGKRHAFPNEKTFFSWYSDFRGVLTVSPTFLASLPLGRNATYRPGIRLVKFPSVPKTYAVGRGGILRWITSESAAASIYGPAWRLAVDDISEAFYQDYHFGTDVSDGSSFNPVVESALVTTIDQNE